MSVIGLAAQNFFQTSPPMTVDNPQHSCLLRIELGLEKFASIMLGNLDSCYQLLLKKDEHNLTFDQFMMMV
ncbi:hypothetical protein DY262_21090 [Hydrogenophaga borbori]|uniref:Uncharacterized protein n=1 Tax=Hydrogenophaga borbori TaxID=2294117 RepID=A0A372EDY9_9BURK|nr:hypothetical protein DY262_21090 [Hydrogenophaga borbori]